MRRQLLILLSLVFVLSLFPSILAVTPTGASVSPGVSSAGGAGSPQSNNATAGNVTELTISGVSNTQSWQGYYGNVTGVLRLANSAGNQMYNWSLASPSGEVYASTSDDVTWSSIECFNYTADGTTLEASFNISVNDTDGVNETFTTGNGHDAFYTNNIAFTSGQCMSTQIFDSTGAGVNDHFEEVLLWDGANIVFTALLEKDVSGFDSNYHDFEMLVLENGHGTDTSPTAYYFYAELG
jgi:hypothetical protein